MGTKRKSWCEESEERKKIIAFVVDFLKKWNHISCLPIKTVENVILVAANRKMKGKK